MTIRSLPDRRRIRLAAIPAVLLLLLASILFPVRPVDAFGFPNPGFESGLDGWTTYGSVSIGTGGLYPTGMYQWTVNPYETGMAVLVPSGSPGVFTAVADTLGLDGDSRDYLSSVFPPQGYDPSSGDPVPHGGGMTNFAYICADFLLEAGEAFTMSWNYVATDYEPFNDASFISLVNLDEPTDLPWVNGYRAQVGVLGATVLGTGSYSTGSYGSTGWQTASLRASKAGTYRMGFVVYNLDDTILSPYLFVDKEPGTTLKDGMPFEPIPPDASPPPPPSVSAPSVSTGTISDVTAESVRVAGDVTSDGGSPVTDRGIVAGLSPDPTLLDLVFPSGSGTGSFTVDLTGLDPGVTYHVRAYAVNSEGVSYGEDGTFTTRVLQSIDFPMPPDATYGDTDFAVGATATSGLPVGYASSEPGVATVEDGMVRIHGAGTTVLTATQPGNETYAAAVPVERTLVVSPKELVVTADSLSKILGQDDPDLTVHYNGFAEGDDDSLVTGLVLGREPGEEPGVYGIVPSGAAASNYSLIFVGGTLTIRDLYLATFDSRGGSPVAFREIAEGDLVSIPGEPTWDGAVFDGWFADENLETPFDFSTPIAGDVTIRARWQVTVLPDPDSGSWIGGRFDSRWSLALEPFPVDSGPFETGAGHVAAGMPDKRLMALSGLAILHGSAEVLPEGSLHVHYMIPDAFRALEGLVPALVSEDGTVTPIPFIREGDALVFDLDTLPEGFLGLLADAVEPTGEPTGEPGEEDPVEEGNPGTADAPAWPAILLSLPLLAEAALALGKRRSR